MKTLMQRIGAFWIGALLGAMAAPATTLERMPLEKLTSRADAVVHVRCLSNESRWERGEIWTFTQFEVEEALKGVAPRLLTVRLLGGKVGHLISTVDAVPRFRPGEETVLFLERMPDGAFTVLSWAQGTFRIRREQHTGRAVVTQDSAGLAVFDPARQQFRTEGVRNLPLASFKQRIARVVMELQRKGQQ